MIFNLFDPNRVSLLCKLCTKCLPSITLYVTKQECSIIGNIIKTVERFKKYSFLGLIFYENFSALSLRIYLWWNLSHLFFGVRAEYSDKTLTLVSPLLIRLKTGCIASFIQIVSDFSFTPSNKNNIRLVRRRKNRGRFHRYKILNQNLYIHRLRFILPNTVYY